MVIDERNAIKTPETHPDHDTVGHFFKDFWYGWIYYCDSYDPRIGFWMTPVLVDPKWEHEKKDAKRTNVSERAINRTWHEVRSWDPLFELAKETWNARTPASN